MKEWMSERVGMGKGKENVRVLLTHRSDPHPTEAIYIDSTDGQQISTGAVFFALLALLILPDAKDVRESRLPASSGPS